MGLTGLELFRGGSLKPSLSNAVHSAVVAILLLVFSSGCVNRDSKSKPSSPPDTKAVSSSPPLLVTNGCAVAALRENGSVITWGAPDCGGDSLSVAADLSSGVKSLSGMRGQFAAIKTDGSVVLWPKDSQQAADPELTKALRLGGTKSVTMGVRHITLLKDDGSVYVWRMPAEESGIIAPEDELKSGVKDVISNGVALVALKFDGSAVAFGYKSNGGDASSVAAKLKSGVIAVKPTQLGFIALKDDGSAVIWGSWDTSSELPEVVNELSTGVVDVVAAEKSGFAALKNDGSVFSWRVGYDGTIPKTIVTNQLAPTSGVVRIFSNDWSFAAIMSDGSVKTWGGYENSTHYGSDSSSVASQIASDVVDVIAARRSYVAVKKDGSLVTWGYHFETEGFATVAPMMTSPVSSVYSNGEAYLARLVDGRSFLWGDSFSTGSAKELPRNLQSLVGTAKAFVGVDTEGAIYGWGDARFGGDPYCESIPRHIKREEVSCLQR